MHYALRQDGWEQGYRLRGRPVWEANFNQKKLQNVSPRGHNESHRRRQ